MSKRTAQWQGGDERYGGYSGQAQQEDISDKPVQATAAQLAKRKIAQLKRRPRSESPLTNTGSIYEQANGLMSTSNNNVQAPSNPFANASSFSFGNTTGNANGATTSSFGSGGGSFNFGGNSTQPANTGASTNAGTGFTFGSSNGTTPASSFTFGQQAQPSQAPPSNGFTPSTNFSFGQQNGTPSTGFQFGQGDATPKPASANLFGSAVNGERNPSETQNIFGQSQETPKAQNNIFSAPKPADNMFGNNNASQSSSGGSKGFTFGTPSENKNGTTAATQSNIFSGFGQAKASEPQTETTNTNGWAAFTQQKPATPQSQPTNGIATPSASLFSTAQTNGSTAPSTSIFSGLNAQTSKVPTFKFAPEPNPPTADNDFSMISPENTPQKSSSTPSAPFQNGFGNTAASSTPKPLFETGKGPSLFDRITKDASSTAAADAPAAAPAATSTTSKPLFQPSTTLFGSKPTVSGENATARLPAPEPSATVSSTESANTGTTSPETFESVRELNESLLQHLQGQDANKDWSKIFQFYLSEVAQLQNGSSSTVSAPQGLTASHTPTSKPAFSFGSSLLGKPHNAPATTGLFGQATTSALTSTDDSNDAQKSLYPKLPESASNTAKLFQATLEKKNTSTPSTSLFSAKPPTEQTKSDDAVTTSGGFKPSVAAPAGSSFLSSFGQKANDTAEKEKERRRDEDFDSDEDDEAEWERKDQEAQAAKKASLEAAAKASGGFVFKPAASSGPAPGVFSGFGQAQKTAEASTQPSTTSSLFNFGSTASTSAAAPKLGLFGAPSTPATTGTSSNIFANAVKASTPGPLFSFGQSSSTPAPTINASTPQETTTQDGEDGDAAPPEPQLEDMAVLLPSEASENDVLFYMEKSKSRKLESRPAEGGTEKLTWVDKGLGPLWILRNKSSGKSRVLQKIKDSGRAAMNFTVLAGDKLYKHEGMNGKAVTATFVDHIGSSDGKPSRWLIMVGKPDDAKEITRVLQEEAKKAV